MSQKESYDEAHSVRFKQKNLIAIKLGDELLLYEEDTCTAHCLNEIAGEMWVACERDSSALEVAEALRTTWPDIEKELVWASLRQLAAQGLLEQRTEQENISTSRRELIRKLGFTAAAVLPIVVTSVLIPPPAAAASCAKLGESCGTTPCCAGIGLGCVEGICVNISH